MLRAILNGGVSVSESSVGKGRFGESYIGLRAVGGDWGGASGSMLGIVLGLVCVAGETMGRMVVGSKPCSLKRR